MSKNKYMRPARSKAHKDTISNTKNDFRVNKPFHSVHDEYFLLNFECKICTISINGFILNSAIYAPNSARCALCCASVDIIYITKDNSHKQSNIGVV